MSGYVTGSPAFLRVFSSLKFSQQTGFTISHHRRQKTGLGTVGVAHLVRCLPCSYEDLSSDSTYLCKPNLALKLALGEEQRQRDPWSKRAHCSSLVVSSWSSESLSLKNYGRGAGEKAQ